MLEAHTGCGPSVHQWQFFSESKSIHPQSQAGLAGTQACPHAGPDLVDVISTWCFHPAVDASNPLLPMLYYSLQAAHGRGVGAAGEGGGAANGTSRWTELCSDMFAP